MKLRRLKHMFLRLSTEEKVLGIGCLTVLIGTFLPWYSVIFSYEDKNILESGFSGHLGVIGFVIFLLTLLSISFLVADHLSIKLPKFGLKKEWIIMFLTGESAFLILLMVAVNVKRSLEYTNAELRFGLYVSLIGSLISAFAAFSQIQKNQKKDVKTFFGQTEEEAVIQTITENEDNNPYIKKPEELTTEVKDVIENTVNQSEQKNFFYEENTDSENEEELFINNDELPKITDELDNEEDEEKPYNKTIDKDEIIEGNELKIIAETPIDEEKTAEVISLDEENEEKPYNKIVDKETPIDEEKTAEVISLDEENEEMKKNTEDEKTETLETDIKNNLMTTEEIENKKSSEQGSYFIREAGVAINSEVQTQREKKPNIKVDMKSIKKVEDKGIKPQKKRIKPSNENLSIYDDM